MESRELKLIRGLLCFLTAAIIYYFNIKISNEAWHRLLFCFIYSFVGLGIKGIYYGVKKRQGKKEEKIINCIGSFVFNWWAALAVTSFIYLVLYDSFQKADVNLFHFISLLIFSYSGFIIDEIKPNLLG